MGIVVKHGPDAGIMGALAFAAGAGQKQRRRGGGGFRSSVAPSSRRSSKRRVGSFVGEQFLTFEEQEAQARIAALQAQTAGEGQSIDPDDKFRTRQEIRTGIETEEGRRVRASSNLNQDERGIAIRKLSQQERVDPNQFKSPEEKQEAFEASFDQNVVFRDGMAWTLGSKGEWKATTLPDQAKGVMDSRDMTRAMKQVAAENPDDDDLSLVERKRKAIELLRAESEALAEFKGGVQEPEIPGTGTIDFVDPTAQIVDAINQAEAQQQGVTFAETPATLDANLPTNEFFGPVRASQAPQATQDPEATGVEIPEDRLKFMQKHLTKRELTMIEANIQVAETDEEVQRIITLAAQKATLNSLPDDHELKKKKNPMLEALFTLSLDEVL